MFEQMKKITLFIFLLSFVVACGQKPNTIFKVGEQLQYKMSYSGFLRAGTATLELREAEVNQKKVFHAIGKGWTTGLIKWFFNVKDNYQTYFDKESGKPYLFKRKINEGGYKIHREITFDYLKHKAIIKDFRKQKEIVKPFLKVQDILSSFYHLRAVNTEKLKKGDEIVVNMFLDFQIYTFKLKYLGKEIIFSKFGNINTLVFRPLVQSGRIFKAEESVTIWVTNDRNKIPIKLKADLAVGSLQAELERFKNLANPLF